MTLTLIILTCLFFGARDGINYAIHGKPIYKLGWVKYWHIIGAALYGLVCFSLTQDWYVLLQAAVIRLGFFDIAYNAFAGKWLGYIGTEAMTDKITSKLFRNALIKAAVCLVALIVMIWLR